LAGASASARASEITLFKLRAFFISWWFILESVVILTGILSFIPSISTSTAAAGGKFTASENND
jgi:hypothetical protein